MILDSSGNLYPNNDGDQSLGQSSNRWRNLFLRQGGQIQIGDATNTNWIGITEGLVNTYTDQDFISTSFSTDLCPFTPILIISGILLIPSFLTNLTFISRFVSSSQRGLILNLNLEIFSF